MNEQMSGYTVYANLSEHIDMNIYRKQRVWYGNKYEYHWFASDMKDSIKNTMFKDMAHHILKIFSARKIKE